MQNEKSKKNFILNFPAILSFLEKNKGLDVSEARKLYGEQLETNKKDTYIESKYSEEDRNLAIKDPDIDVLRSLENILKKTDPLDSTEGLSDFDRTLKYLEKNVLDEVLKQQKQILGFSKGKAGIQKG